MLSQPLYLDTMMKNQKPQDDNPEVMSISTPTAIDIASLQATIERLYMLCDQHTQNLSQPTIETNDAQFPSLSLATQSPPPWKYTTYLNSIKQSMLEKCQQCRIQRQENAARFLQPPSENQGFQLDINNSRILYINYPSRNIVDLLIHNDYAPELKAHLQKFIVNMNEDLNPCDRSILMDPKYEQSTKEEPNTLAFMHHYDRRKRAVNYICVPVKTAVARYFYNQGWIDKQTFTEHLQLLDLNQRMSSTSIKTSAVHHIPHKNPLLAKYTLSFIISKILVHCLYRPPSLSHTEISNILQQLPLEFPNTTSTIVCGDLNAKVGIYTGDTLFNYRGRILVPLISGKAGVSFSVTKKTLKDSIHTGHTEFHGVVRYGQGVLPKPNLDIRL
ncbi:hypothetical protein G6F43_012201 [Rhizopus delemar]|nr:hypothetical protein G6F43_012201 [Rhizopus delemar]